MCLAKEEIRHFNHNSRGGHFTRFWLDHLPISLGPRSFLDQHASSFLFLILSFLALFSPSTPLPECHLPTMPMIHQERLRTRSAHTALHFGSYLEPDSINSAQKSVLVLLENWAQNRLRRTAAAPLFPPPLDSWGGLVIPTTDLCCQMATALQPDVLRLSTFRRTLP